MVSLFVDRSLNAAASTSGAASVGLNLVLVLEADADGVSQADVDLQVPSAADEAILTMTTACVVGDPMTLEEYLSLLNIWNMAFTQLGVPTIDATTDTVSQAVIATNNWDLFKEQFLGDHAWNGAKKTVELSKFLNNDTTEVTPAARWSYAFELPSDYVRALRINGKEMRPESKHWTGYGLWEEEILTNNAGTTKRCIVTDQSTVFLEYIFLVADGDIVLLSGLTRTALALSFAAFLSSKFGKTPAEKMQLEQIAEEALRKARRADSTIGTRLIPRNYNLIWSRF